MKSRVLGCVFALLLGCSEDGSTDACDANVCQCTEDGIRAAIAEGGGPFTFDCEGQTTVVTRAEIVIDNEVILDAGGDLTVDGNMDHRVFSVPEGATATLDGFTVTGGTGLQYVGSITNLGTLHVIRSQVSGNASTGIQNFGTLTLTDSGVSSNSGDGVQSLNPNVGLPNEGFAVATVTNCVLSDNDHDGLASQGEATLMDTTISNNGISGIRNEGNASLTNCTVSANARLVPVPATEGDEVGSGVDNLSEGEMVLTNTTVSGNGAIGLFNGRVGKVTLVSCTMAEHSVADIGNNGDATLVNTVVAGGCDPNGLGDITSGGHNVESPGQTCGLDTDGTDIDDVSPEDLKLGPLQDNGGPTETRALDAGSIAINAIPEADCLDAEGEPLVTDQRGEPRPGGGTCDVGAFEFNTCGIEQPDPWQPGDERLSVGWFYECGRSETISIDGVAADYLVFVTDPGETINYRTGSSTDRLEGQRSDEITLNGTPFWGGGIIWYEPFDLSEWTTMFVGFKSSDPSFASFDLTLQSGAEEEPASVVLDPTTYGYTNDGEWHFLQIPLQDAIDLGWDPSTARSPFIFSAVGGDAGDVLLIDNLYFTKD